MAYILVLLLAAAAGTAVGIATFRTGQSPRARPDTWTQTYEAPAPVAGSPSEPQPPATEMPTGRRPPLPGDPTTRSRIGGVLGLLIACLVAAAAIVAALYAVYLALRGAFAG